MNYIKYRYIQINNNNNNNKSHTHLQIYMYWLTEDFEDYWDFIVFKKNDFYKIIQILQTRAQSVSVVKNWPVIVLTHISHICMSNCW